VANRLCILELTQPTTLSGRGIRLTIHRRMRSLNTTDLYHLTLIPGEVAVVEDITVGGLRTPVGGHAVAYRTPRVAEVLRCKQGRVTWYRQSTVQPRVNVRYAAGWTVLPNRVLKSATVHNKTGLH